MTICLNSFDQYFLQILKVTVTINKFFCGFIALSFASLSIQLIPLSRKALSWNRCLIKTTDTLSSLKAVQDMDDQGKEVLSVMICNGAVFEPRIKSNIK